MATPAVQVVLMHQLTTESRSEMGAADVLSAALILAAGGLRVFPLFGSEDGLCRCGDKQCASPAKHPLTCNGAHDATSDPLVIEHWFVVLFPSANLGLATAGLRAYDIDGQPGRESLERLEHLYGHRFPRTRTQRSGRRSGEHLIYSLPAGCQSSASPRLAARLPDLHIRSGGGMYVCSAPSRHANGSRYEMDDHPIVELPDWALEPPPGFGRPQPAGELPPFRVATRDHRYGLGAVRSERERVLRVAPGEGRHDALNTAAFRLGQLVYEGKLTIGTIYGALVAAGVATGIGERDSRRIVRLGIEAGLEHPRCR